MSNTKIIAVVGGTGAMGRPVVRALLADERYEVRILTRDPQSPEATALVASGRVTCVVGRNDDAEAVATLFRGAHGAFINTNFFATVSVEAEHLEGVALLEAAKQAGVEHVVYSSLDPMGAISGGAIPCPHFDSKASVAAHIDRRRADDFMRRVDGDAWYLEHTTVLVTLPYFENFKSFFAPYPGKLSDGRDGLIFSVPLGDAPLPMVALDDIGAFVAIILGDPSLRGRSLSIGSQTMTIAEVAEVFTRTTGVPAEYRPLTLEQFGQFDLPFKHDLLNMMRFFNEHRLHRDHAALRGLHPGLRTFEAWLRESGWRGEREQIFKSAG